MHPSAGQWREWLGWCIKLLIRDRTDEYAHAVLLRYEWRPPHHIQRNLRVFQSSRTFGVCPGGRLPAAHATVCMFQTVCSVSVLPRTDWER